MKIKWCSLKFIFAVCLLPLCVHTQSTIEFQSGTTIEATTGADICADNIIINGTYSGDGTRCGGVLPVELVVLTVSTSGRVVTLAWQTTTEMNNYGFDIEKSAVDSQASVNRWEKIGFVEGNGNSNSPKSYSFVDENLMSGKYAYRLKQIDRDGQFKYSQQVEVAINNAPSEFALNQNYPNPFNPATVINYQLPVNSFVTLKVYNVIGKEVATLVNGMQEAGRYIVQLDGSKLSSGIYFYALRADNFAAAKKMLLMK